MNVAVKTLVLQTSNLKFEATGNSPRVSLIFEPSYTRAFYLYRLSPTLEWELVKMVSRVGGGLLTPPRDYPSPNIQPMVISASSLNEEDTYLMVINDKGSKKFTFVFKHQGFIHTYDPNASELQKIFSVTKNK
jgi:hypothetical protein